MFSRWTFCNERNIQFACICVKHNEMLIGLTWVLVATSAAHRISFEGPLNIFHPVCSVTKSNVAGSKDIALWAPLEYRTCSGSHTAPVRAAWLDRMVCYLWIAPSNQKRAIKFMLTQFLYCYSL
eukprot:Gregarina_sp_Poly_1__3655@NODE_2078_length_2726_cov_26_942460_g1340_i0_p3_GENE_NODE_2078_length_2726_cov_26_942460_g1340_i0NODE_2078_length_2726_cov_26_942460_g1340_i0_p3_ORF_typecomplete_len124_score5_18_NODE_2078_length_2726_cov_26_942460_g1340_i010341405